MKAPSPFTGITMSTTPAADQAPKPAGKAKSLVPPDEQLWTHYSPHHEFSLSSVGSFTLHGLTIGLLILIALGVINLGAGPLGESRRRGQECLHAPRSGSTEKAS